MWWAIGGGFISFITATMMIVASTFNGGGDWPGVFKVVFLGTAGGMSILAIIAWSIGRKYSDFVHMSEIVFQRLGWRDVQKIDLPAKTRRLRQPGDPDELGTTYFRY